MFLPVFFFVQHFSTTYFRNYIAEFYPSPPLRQFRQFGQFLFRQRRDILWFFRFCQLSGAFRFSLFAGCLPFFHLLFIVCFPFFSDAFQEPFRRFRRVAFLCLSGAPRLGQLSFKGVFQDGLAVGLQLLPGLFQVSDAVLDLGKELLDSGDDIQYLSAISG